MTVIQSDFQKFLETQSSRTTEENLKVLETLSRRRKKNHADLDRHTGEQIVKWLDLKHDLEWDISILQIEINRIESRKEWPR